MKKKTMVLGGLIAAVAITGYSVSGTYAKYVSEVEKATDTARVAKWIDLTADTTSTELNLFKVAYGNASEIKSGDSDKVVAPGAKNTATLTLSTSAAEVDYKLAVEVDLDKSVNAVKNGAYDPIEFCVAADCTDEANWVKLSGLNTELKKLDTARTTIKAGTTGSDTITFNWRWNSGYTADDVTAAEGGDATAVAKIKAADLNDTTIADTLKSKAAADTLKLGLKITATQVLPTE